MKEKYLFIINIIFKSTPFKSTSLCERTSACVCVCVSPTVCISYRLTHVFVSKVFRVHILHMFFHFIISMELCRLSSHQNLLSLSSSSRTPALAGACSLTHYRQHNHCRCRRQQQHNKRWEKKERKKHINFSRCVTSFLIFDFSLIFHFISISFVLSSLLICFIYSFIYVVVFGCGSSRFPLQFFFLSVLLCCCCCCLHLVSSCCFPLFLVGVMLVFTKQRQ